MKIDILGTSFTVQSDQDPAYLRDISHFFGTKVDEIRRSVSTSDPLKISILAGLLITDEYFKHKNSAFPGQDDHEATAITQELIKKLDLALQGVREKDGSTGGSNN